MMTLLFPPHRLGAFCGQWDLVIFIFNFRPQHLNQKMCALVNGFVYKQYAKHYTSSYGEDSNVKKQRHNLKAKFYRHLKKGLFVQLKQRSKGWTKILIFIA